MKPTDAHRPLITIFFPIDLGLQIAITKAACKHLDGGNPPWSADGKTLTIYAPKEATEAKEAPNA